MIIIEQIKFWKLRKYIWDEELEQTCGKIAMNTRDDKPEFCFNPDKVLFDARQLKKIIKLLEKANGGTSQ